MTREQKEITSRTTVRPNKDNLYQALIIGHRLMLSYYLVWGPNGKRHTDYSLITFALLAHVNKKSVWSVLEVPFFPSI